MKSQADFSGEDVSGEPIDLVFLDAAHDFDINCETWRSLEPCLAPDALVFVHDTGLWQREYMLDRHRMFIQYQAREAWVETDTYAHQLDERRFVNWLLETYPKYAAVHLHSTRVLRHGMTIVQKQSPLAV